MPGESKSSPREIQNYLGRISGPLLDRIDLHVEVPQVKFREISGDRIGETSAQIRGRAYDRILKVMRTIADLAGAENILSDHISEAIQYRSLERQLRA
jgi:magnesium chelatase family protein